VDPKSRTYAIPYPGTFIVDRKGVVSRFFEDAYQERYTAATILNSLGTAVGGGIDRVCFNPTRVPISFVVSVKGLDRRPPG